MGFARFNLVWPALLLVTLTCAAAVNLTVDPYSVFGSPRVAGFNAQKAKASTYTPLVKAHQIERARPVTVLLGTSRVDIGLDPVHPAWPGPAKPVYNYGLPEASILTMPQQLGHALQAGAVRTAVVGLEFQDFLRGQVPAGRQPDEVEGRFLALAQDRSQWRHLRQAAIDNFTAAMTLGALLDSVGTVAQQRSAAAGDVTDAGLTSETPYADLVRRDGHHDLFLQKDLGIVRARQQAARVLAGRLGEFAEIAQLRALIELCRTRGIELKLLIPPYPPHYLEIVDATGLWGRFEDWKRALVKVVAEYQGQPGPGLSLWDFATYDEYTTEPVPAKGDRKTTMQWFWEPVHFKKALGDIMLARMLGQDTRDFGVELTPATLEPRLAAARVQQAAYRQRLPAEAQAIAALVRTAR